MKNDETWKFGNEYCGRLWYRIGLIIVNIKDNSPKKKTVLISE